jgi:tripartite-type tricarboxylate transporter receptor subunit TctC
MPSRSEPVTGNLPCYYRSNRENFMGRLPLLVAMALATSLSTIGAARAQEYPSRAITIVVGFPPGGSADVIARIVAERMRVSLGQPVIIENVAGAAGSLGAGRVARAAPDGYMFSMGSLGTHVFNSALYTLPYDVVDDFEPVSLLVSQPQLILARKTMPAKDLKELIDWLKENPDKASQLTAGVGSTSHVAGIFFQRETGTRFQFVPYRGAGPGMQDLVAGRIDLMIDQVTNSLPQVRSGSIKAYAVTAVSRLSAAPEIPTVDEAGLPGFYMGNWFGVWGPKATPKDVIAKLNSAVVDALSDPAVRQRFADLGVEIYPREQRTPEALGALQKVELQKWRPIIKAAGIKSE